MNIKSLLLGSAAALAAVSGAQAADAIVAVEPEPVEYVRVCDTFGTGYFYIPGTETCLKLSGYVRFQVDARSKFDRDELVGRTWERSKAQRDGYRTRTRGQLRVEAKSDTELGTLGSRITLRANNDANSQNFYLEDTYIELGGLRVGYFYNYFDDGLPGETVLSDGGPLAGADYIGGNTLNNSIRYTFKGDGFEAYGQVDSFVNGWQQDTREWVVTNGVGRWTGENIKDAIGINAFIGGSFGAFKANLFGAYEFDNEDGVIATTLTAEIGPGELGIFGAWSSGASYYWDFAEWTIGAEYAIALTDSLKLAPGVQYWDKIQYNGKGDYKGGDAWRVGATLDYKIVDNLTFKATVNYTDVDSKFADTRYKGDRWDGFVRLQRSF